MSTRVQLTKHAFYQQHSEEKPPNSNLFSPMNDWIPLVFPCLLSATPAGRRCLRLKLFLHGATHFLLPALFPPHLKCFRPHCDQTETEVNISPRLPRGFCYCAPWTLPVWRENADECHRVVSGEVWRHQGAATVADQNLIQAIVFFFVFSLIFRQLPGWDCAVFTV